MIFGGTMNKELLKADIESVLSDKYEITADKAQPYQLHEALSSAIMKQIAPVWKDSRKAHLATRRACYFSAEFLVGRAIYNNLLCLGVEDDAREVLSSLGAKLSDLEEIEDAALGNGGLGRLAACFLDSAATLSLPLDGYGIRYKYGLFKQSIVDGFQKEEADKSRQDDVAATSCEESDPMLIHEIVTSPDRGTHTHLQTIKFSFTFKRKKLLVCVGNDVTLQYQMMEQLRDALSKAEQADTLKAQFIANMSHEIRTPLNSIIGFSQLMAEAENQTDRDEYNRIISLNNNLLLNLFEDVLNLSMLDSDNMSFKNDEFDFSAMFDELAVLMREKMSNPEVEFICENPLQTLMVKTDRERLTQVIGNLITNAAKFTGQGYIKMGYARKNDGVQIYVEDTGLGIEEKNLVEVFDRFKKLNVFIQGTGLGLPICKSIVNQMGGEIWVESEYGKGSTFYVWLPCLC